MSDLIEIGKVNGIHGVRGWVKIFSHTHPRENILSYATWQLLISGNYRQFHVLNGRKQGKGIVAQLREINDRDTARELIDTPIYIQRNQLQPTQNNEFYWHDLIGLEVKNLQGIVFGHVTHLLATGANDVLVIKNEEKERLVPFTFNHAVIAVDLEGREITVDWDADF